ncbi:MAG: cytochrome c biogenesis protein CcsA [Planctomycetes bacterium]|nr:cytochrome c biogenesis protein CcsA [Planctomycetota bacterium]
MTSLTPAYGALTLYLVAGTLWLVSAARRKPPLATAARALAGVGVVIHAVSVALQWIADGHIPLVSLYELVSAGTLACVAGYRVFAWMHGDIPEAGASVAFASFVVMGLALQTPTEPSAMNEALKSYWLIVHVIFALAAYGGYTIAAALGTAYLVRARQGADRQEALAHRLILLGFVAHAVMVLSGAIWAHRAWGRYWAWDPIEIWSLGTWLVYALYLHLWSVHGWRGRRAAWFAALALPLIVACYWAVPLFSKSIHAYSKGLR